MTDLAHVETATVTETTTTHKPAVMLVEDDVDLCAAISEYLSKNGMLVSCVHRGDQAVHRFTADKPDLIVLDIMLPGRDGFQVCRDLRAIGCVVPIMMLTAKDEDFDRVVGLELGADDYLLKPIQPRVLLAHVKAMLRRHTNVSPSESAAELLIFGRLKINRSALDVFLDEERVRMTAAEFELLWLLASNAGRVLHREEILQKLRGLEHAHEDRSVDARLYRLRKRFVHVPDIQNRIKSVRPHGYMFSVSPW